VWGEYEGRESNGGKEDHYGSGYCSRDIVKSAVDAMHSEDKGGCMQLKDTSLIVPGVPEFCRSDACRERELTPAPPSDERGGRDPLFNR
jgi:hypothetical protein